jgi:hypothetical protein
LAGFSFCADAHNGAVSAIVENAATIAARKHLRTTTSSNHARITEKRRDR